MIRNDQVQAAIIARLKANATIKALVVSGTFQDETWDADIREDQWQGTTFGYPNIRVRLLPATPLGDKDCSLIRFSVSLMAFSEEGSSLEADQIAGIINNELHGKTFTSNNIEISLRSASLIPAVRTDTRTWRSEALMNGIASG
jgi:hypothetical protein